MPRSVWDDDDDVPTARALARATPTPAKSARSSVASHGRTPTSAYETPRPASPLRHGGSRGSRRGGGGGGTVVGGTPIRHEDVLRAAAAAGSGGTPRQRATCRDACVAVCVLARMSGRSDERLRRTTRNDRWCGASRWMRERAAASLPPRRLASVPPHTTVVVIPPRARTRARFPHALTLATRVSPPPSARPSSRAAPRLPPPVCV